MGNVLVFVWPLTLRLLLAKLPDSDRRAAITFDRALADIADVLLLAVLFESII